MIKSFEERKKCDKKKSTRRITKKKSVTKKLHMTDSKWLGGKP